MSDVGPEPGQAALRRTVGVPTAKTLGALGIETLEDLLRYYPRRYDEPGRLTDLSALRVGEHVTVMARVVSTTLREMRARRGFVVSSVITDGTRRLNLTFFPKHYGRAKWLEERLHAGVEGSFSGVVGHHRGSLQLVHPDTRLIGEDGEDAEDVKAEARRPVPVYRANAKLPSWKIAKVTRTVVDTLRRDEIPEPLPDDVRDRHGLVDALEAFRGIHRPEDEDEWRAARRRLRFEEAFVLQAALARNRVIVGEQAAVARPPVADGLVDRFDARLPFELTAGQREVGGQIAADLVRARPMRRLLQGDVGSGKTVVALRAMLQVVDAGGQAALLAPTEVLAAQHLRSLDALLGDLAAGGLLGGADIGTQVVLLTGSQSVAARRTALAKAASGEAGIVVGTHALLGEHVSFADLGLVVVDEQHRFGVEQRDALRDRGTAIPHLLVMTATPIPRTVAMTIFGDLEVSTLSEVPAGRPEVVTHVVPADNAAWLDRAWRRVREEVDRGGRAYVVCARIESGDESGADGAEMADDGGDLAFGPGRAPLRAVADVAAELRAHPALAGVGIGALHGRMPGEDKERTMAAFAAGELPVLVSTTVIEVGVDVPTATAMVVLDADRFGISQLHQLRGRIGRGAAPGVCLLVSAAAPDTPAAQRLEILSRTRDGFELADADLELRREGDVLGAAQSGVRSSLRLLRVTRDGAIIAAAREEAERVVATGPALAEFPDLLTAIQVLLSGERERFLERA